MAFWSSRASERKRSSSCHLALSKCGLSRVFTQRQEILKDQDKWIEEDKKKKAEYEKQVDYLFYKFLSGEDEDQREKDEKKRDTQTKKRMPTEHELQYGEFPVEVEEFLHQERLKNPKEDGKRRRPRRGDLVEEGEIWQAKEDQICARDEEEEELWKW